MRIISCEVQRRRSCTKCREIVNRNGYIFEIWSSGFFPERLCIKCMKNFIETAERLVSEAEWYGDTSRNRS